MAAEDTSMTGDTEGRDPHGRFTRQPDTVERDAEALRLKARGKTYARIAEALGYTDKGAAYKAVQRGLATPLQEPAAEVRSLELERLDYMYDKVITVLEAKHLTVSQGRIIQQEIDVERDENGTIVLDGDGKPIPIYEPLEDDAPVLHAVDRLLKIQERRARLLGLDVPTRLSIDAENIGREIAELIGALSDDSPES